MSLYREENYVLWNELHYASVIKQSLGIFNVKLFLNLKNNFILTAEPIHKFYASTLNTTVFFILRPTYFKIKYHHFVQEIQRLWYLFVLCKHWAANYVNLFKWVSDCNCLVFILWTFSCHVKPFLEVLAVLPAVSGLTVTISCHLMYQKWLGMQ